MFKKKTMRPRDGMGAVSGEAMEPAIKHTYMCGSDDWYSEKTEVSIAGIIEVLHNVSFLL
jgi:hypothetical protein